MSKKDKRSALERACDQKLDEIAEELLQTNCAAERIKVLTENAEELKKCKKTDKKGFKAWIKRLEAKDVIAFSFSIIMFVIMTWGESAGKFISSRVSGFVPWNKPPKI